MLFYDFLNGVQIRGMYSGELKKLKNDRSILIEMPLLFGWLIENKFDVRQLLAFPSRLSNSNIPWPEDVGRTPLWYENRIFYLVNPHLGLKGAYMFMGNRTWIEQCDFIEFEKIRPVREDEDWFGEVTQNDLKAWAREWEMRSKNLRKKVEQANEHLRIKDGTPDGRKVTYDDVSDAIEAASNGQRPPFEYLGGDNASK